MNKEHKASKFHRLLASIKLRKVSIFIMMHAPRDVGWVGLDDCPPLLGLENIDDEISCSRS